MRILLWELRNAKGLSDREVAALSGLSKTTINNIENCRTSPTLQQLERLAAALDTGMVDFFDSRYKYGTEEREDRS